MSKELGISAKKNEFSKWYLEVIDKCQIADKRYGIKGFPVYMPWGMFLIKQITLSLERELEKTGHSPVSFPVLIPEKNLKKEKDHVRGFEDEVFWVTHAGKSRLDERLFLRPTSETAFYPLYSLWIRSHADLPLKLYQSVQVYRHDTKMTKPLFRGREFFWIETHTVQKNNADAESQVEEDMAIYERVLSLFGIPFLLIERPSWDRFPGAEASYAYDTIMPDGNCLQVGTTHNLGQKFSKAFDITFTDDKGKKIHAYQTCFGPGISRVAAAIISVHGDDKGLVMPPHISPVQVVIIPIPIKGKEKAVIDASKKIASYLEGMRVKIDDRKYRPGFKFNEWEMKGVPIRIEIGPKDAERKEVTIVTRDNGKKEQAGIKNLENTVRKKLDEMHCRLKERADSQHKKWIKDASDFSMLRKMIDSGGFVRANFCSMDGEGEKCAERIEKEAVAEVRGRLFHKNEQPKGPCVICGNAATCVVYIARAY